MRPGARVGDDAAGPVERIVAPADVLGLAVRLTAVHLELELAAPFVDAALELVQAEPAVERRITATDDVEVDPVQDGDAHAATLLGDQLVERSPHPLLRELDAGDRLARHFQQDEARRAVDALLVARDRSPRGIAVDLRLLWLQHLLDRGGVEAREPQRRE